MYLLLLVAILCGGSALGQVQVPCYGEGCVNVTVYLGPRWGSRVIMVPRTMNRTKNVGVSGDRFEDHDETYRRPQYKPVPQTGEVQVDFMDDESLLKTTQNVFKPYKDYNRLSWWRPSTTSRPTEEKTIPTNHPDFQVRIVVDKYGRGTLDLSWRGYTGQDVKEVLHSLAVFERKKVTKLILDGNRIQSLPVLVFPVELEYGLQELSLSDNHFSPPYLTSYTRFELSRLAKLMTLSMTRCGLKSIEMPNIPSLEFLDLSHNELTYLPTSLSRLGSLQELILRDNRLSYLTDSPLSSLTNLWVLDLGDNNLQDVLDEPLENLGSLVTVKLDNNRLQSLPFLNNERTKIVSVANNSLQCSCSLLLWLQQQNIQLQDDFERCHGHENDSSSLSELKVWPERHRHLCDNGSWSSRAWAALALWYERNPDIMSAVYKVVGVTLVVVVLVLLLRRRRMLIAKVKSKGIPYDALVDHQVSTVSGDRCLRHV